MSLQSQSLSEYQNTNTLSRERRLLDIMKRKKKLQSLVKREIRGSQLKKLNYMIIQAQAEYGAVYNETAPILNLPIEILCRMFEAAHDAAFVDGVPKNPLIEIVISHVCRGWRSIALSFPPLWSTFRHDASEWADCKPKERLVAYLERSSSDLLDLYFKFANPMFDEGLQALPNSMLESTLPHVARWRQLSLFFEDDAPLPGFIPRLRQLEAPNLEYLSVRPNAAQETLFLDGLSTGVFLGGAPKLSHLRIDAICPSAYLLLPSNIAVLQIEHYTQPHHPSFFGSWGDFLEILALPSLSSLSIVGEHFSGPESQHSSSITMKNLKHLRYAGENNLFDHFFPFLSAPLLETLTLCVLCAPPAPLILNNVQSFFMLHSLTIINCPEFDLIFFSHLATIAPYVTHLTVGGESGFESVLQCINEQFSKNRKKFWPKINVLTATFYDDNDINLYLDFAQSVANPELIIRTSASVVEQWGDNAVKRLRAMCVLEKIPRGNQVISWPPGVDVPVEEDFFTIEY